MTFQQYPEYADIQADWLGVLPKNWSFQRLRFIANEPLMYGANEAAVLEDRALPRFIRITDVNSDGTLNEDTFRSLPVDVAAPFFLADGDILLARSGATVGKSFQYLASWGAAAYAGYLIRCRPNKDIVVPRFINYYFQTSCYWACINSTLIQSTIENFSAEKYKELRLPLPPKEEQQKIAAFLDWKTAQIDALIAKKKELIEKLKENRLAAITQAVTKGLVAAVLKPSNNQWIDKIPEHWIGMRFGYCTNIQEGQEDPECEPYSDMLLIAPNHIESNTGLVFGLTTASEQGAISGKYLVKKGDVVYSKIRPHLNKVALATFDGLCSADMYPIRCEANMTPEYLLYWMLAQPFLDYATESSMRVAMPKLNRDTLNAAPLLVPPLEEQRAIATHLNRVTRKIDQFLEKVETAITHLTEYRTALITAATTGKIDVRNVRIPDTAPAAT
jgi:type I restriction enzyme S subunit